MLDEVDEDDFIVQLQLCDADDVEDDEIEVDAWKIVVIDVMRHIIDDDEVEEVQCELLVQVNDEIDVNEQ